MNNLFSIDFITGAENLSDRERIMLSSDYCKTDRESPSSSLISIFVCNNYIAWYQFHCPLVVFQFIDMAFQRNICFYKINELSRTK